MRRTVATAAMICLTCPGPAGTAQAQSPLGGFDPADFGKVVIQPRQSASGAGGMTLEQAFGAYHNEPVYAYGATSQAVRLGRPVGRLDVLFEDGSTGYCTAFIVDSDHLLTNHHCIPGLPRNGAHPTVKAAQFVAGYIRPGHAEGVDRYTVAPLPVETDATLDYSVLRVFGDPSARYGTLELTADTPEDGAFLWIIGHPQGQSQHISREGCAASSPAISTEGKLMHSCDTLEGNSGSPVMRLSDKRVVALHHAGDSRSGFNMAIPMARILQDSAVLRAAGGGDTAQPDHCAALWTEAKGLGCLGYSAYLDICATHALAGLARQMSARDCAAAGQAGMRGDAAAMPPDAGAQSIVQSMAQSMAQTGIQSSDQSGTRTGGISVRPSGGDFSDLAEAVRAAPQGTRIEVFPGRYTRPVEVSRPVQIVGVGRAADILLEVSDDTALTWRAASGEVRGISIRQTGAGGSALLHSGGALTLEDVDISAQGEAALTLRAGGRLSARRLVVHSSANAGISVLDGRAEVIDSDLRANNGPGMTVASGGFADLRACRFRGARAATVGGAGLVVAQGGSVRVVDSVFAGHAGPAVDLAGVAGAQILNNRFDDNLGAAIVLRAGTTARIEGNLILGTALAGLDISGGATPEIIDNEIGDGGQSAIYVHDGGAGVLQGNRLRRNAYHGISLRGASRLVVRGNTLADNGFDAIRIREGGGGTYEDNDLSGNHAGAFRVEPDAGPVLRRGNRE